MWRSNKVGTQVRVGGQGTSKVGYVPISVGKDEDRPLVFQDMVVLVPNQGTYPTPHNSPHLGTQGRVK